MTLRSRISHLLSFALFRVAQFVICLLPLEWGFRLGAALGSLGWYLLPAMRRLAFSNLQIAFGREMNDVEIESLARDHFQRLGANLFSAIKVAFMSPEEVSAHIEVEIPDSVEKRRRIENRGFVAMIAHLSNWELFAHLGWLLPEYPPATLYQPLQNPWVDRALRDLRSKRGVRLFSRHDGFLSPIEFIRAGGCLAILVDQHAGDGGVWTPLFDRLASTSPLAATFTLRAKTFLGSIAIQTVGIARWKIIVSEPLDAEEGEDADEMTARINLQLERQIRHSPADWFWLHNRWKLPYPDFLLSKYSRGTTFPSGYDLKKLQPFRLLVCTSDFSAAAALRTMRGGRMDLDLVGAVPRETIASWKILVPQVHFITFEELSNSNSVSYHAAVLLDESPELAKKLSALKIPRRVGFNLPALRKNLNQLVTYRKKQSQRSRYLDIAAQIGATISEEETTFQSESAVITDEIYQQARSILTWNQVPKHVEKNGAILEILTPNETISIRTQKAGLALARIVFPCEHRIFLRLEIEVSGPAILNTYYETWQRPAFVEDRKITIHIPAGRSTQMIELPSQDLLGRLRLIIQENPREFQLHKLEIQALIIPAKT